MTAKMEKNAAGRMVPTEVNGRDSVPFKGVGKHRPEGNKAAPRVVTCVDYPADGDKRASSLKEALERVGLADGMVVSTHHHLRNGDAVGNLIFDAAGVLRSHGGRWQAIQDGEVHIDVAVIAAPAADVFGNANAVHGPAACGLLGFALADSIYAEKVIVVTDNLVPFPCLPWQIQGNNVDVVVEVESIGDPSKIVSGTTRITQSPDRRRIAELAARFCASAGIMRDGFSFQAGAGGTTLAFAMYLAELMRAANVTARFARGGSTQHMVEMLDEGLIECILDGQTFDLDGVKSMRDDPRHQDTSPCTSYNFHGKGNFASMVDVAVLGATEVDLAFNGNVVTHSDGRLLHGIGGWQNCLTARCAMLLVPSFRDRIPVIVDEVTTVCGPGELIDAVVTERGIAINPRRQDLLDAVAGSDLPIRPIEDLKAELDRICGVPARPGLSDDPVAVAKWIDGTVIDTVWRVG
jgi:citrate lyase subunit alpha/citrate CoA-transferase